VLLARGAQLLGFSSPSTGKPAEPPCSARRIRSL
jgi:hypothetical protein